MVAHAFLTMPKLYRTSEAHCEVAQQLAGRLGVGAGVQRALGHVVERWDGRGLPRHVKGEALALPARVVAVAHDAMLFFRLGGRERAVAVVQQRSGGAYDPQVAERFCRQVGPLLAQCETESAWEAVLAAEPMPHARFSEEQFEGALRAIADFADLQSPYTGNHSSGVASLAAAAAERWRLPESEVTAVRQAGLLHDLGRVGVPAGIWNLPRRLTDEEWERVRLHPYYTERVLSRSPVFGSLGSIAAMHHERLDGSGYHRCLPLVMQPPTARVLAAADAYHAMIEPRPHRPALTPEAAADEVRREVKAGWLDGEAVNAVLSAAGHRVRSGRRSWPAGLSEREVEVLRLVARGLSNREMAGSLSISASTVHHHIQHIYDKVGVSTRAAATLFALQHNILETDISDAS